MKILLDQAYSFYQLGMRSNQEDARYPDCDIMPADAWAFAVCDGVGGADKGEVASSTVCRAFERFMDDQDPEQPFRLVDFQEGLSYAFDELYQAMEKAKCTDMATTLTFLCLSPEGVLAAHMGDSRIYQVRPGYGIVYKNSPHSLVEELLKANKITPEEAVDYPQSNYITRCMGYQAPGQPMMAAEVYRSANVEPGDIFFLCSDGVLDVIPESTLIDILMLDHVYAQEKLEEIAERSKHSSDNNTAIIIPVKDVIRTPNELPQMPPCPPGYPQAMPPVPQSAYTLQDVVPDTPKSKLWRKISGIFG